MFANVTTLFLLRRCGGGAERSEAEGVAGTTNLLHRCRHPFRHAAIAARREYAAAIAPRKTGEEKQ
jgi:hypothetical protein